MAETIPDFANHTMKQPVKQQVINDDISDDSLTDDDLRALAKRKLVGILRRSGDSKAVMAAAKELLDRIDGKATQYIKQDVRHSGSVSHKVVGQMTTAQIMAELAMYGHDALAGAGVQVIEGKVERLTD